RNLLAGRSAINRVSSFPVEDHPSQIAGQIASVPVPPGEDPAAFARLDRLEQLVRWCCAAALRAAGLWEERRELRGGLALGVGAAWLRVGEAGGRRRPGGGWLPEAGDSAVVERARRHLRLSGPAVAVSAACASGNVALAQARAWLRLGWVDVCVAGACDMAVS